MSLGVGVGCGVAVGEGVKVEVGGIVIVDVGVRVNVGIGVVASEQAEIVATTINHVISICDLWKIVFIAILLIMILVINIKCKLLYIVPPNGWRLSRLATSAM
jgi:hypothetical protein